jgi:chromosome segregation ATPase
VILRYLQSKVDNNEAELRDAVGKVQRRVDALNVDLKAKDISAMALQNQLEWSQCTVQELETQLRELNAQASHFPKREAALVAGYEAQLEHGRRLHASAQQEEKMTESKYKQLAAEQHQVPIAGQRIHGQAPAIDRFQNSARPPHLKKRFSGQSPSCLPHNPGCCRQITSRGCTRTGSPWARSSG